MDGWLRRRRKRTVLTTACLPKHTDASDDEAGAASGPGDDDAEMADGDDADEAEAEAGDADDDSDDGMDDED